MTAESTLNPDDLIPVDMVPQQFPHLFDNKAQFAWLMRNRDKNGLHIAIVALGPRRLYLSKTRFAEWLANQSEAA